LGLQSLGGFDYSPFDAPKIKVRRLSVEDG